MRTDGIMEQPTAGGRAELHNWLSKIARIAPAAIVSFRVGPDGKMSLPYSTPAFADLYGVRPEDVTEDFSAAWERIHPDDREMTSAAIAESMRTLSVFQREWRVRPAEKGEIWVEGASIPEREPDGGVIWYGYVHDITKRKEQEALVHAREQAFRAVVENSPDLILRYDRACRHTYANPAVAKAMGMPAEAFIGKAVGEGSLGKQGAAAHPGIAIVKEEITHVFESAAATEFECTWPTVDGERLFHVRCVPEFGQEGSVASVLAVWRDITGWKETERHLHALVENIPVSIVRYDTEGRLSYVNPVTMKLMPEAQREDFLGKRVTELVQSTNPDMGKLLFGGSEPGAERRAKYHRGEVADTWR